MNVIVASKNPVKVEATRQAFAKMFDSKTFNISGASIPSGVNDQPMTEDETLTGAINRVENAYKEFPDAKYWVGIEGGIENTAHGMLAFAWVVVKGVQQIGKARSASFFLPSKIQKLVNDGMELGHADDLVFGVDNSKQGAGAIGLLTENQIDRAGLYIPAIIMALIPFKQANHYLPS